MATMVPPKMQQPMRSDCHMFPMSDDNDIMKQILATHSPDCHNFDMKPFLNVIEDIMQRATPPIPGTAIASVIQNQAQLDAMDKKAYENGFRDTLEHLAYTINRTSCEISCKCSGGSDAHTATMTLLNTLSNYSWDNKVVIALAAFAVNYGEFWLVAQLYETNPLAKSVALLKRLPDILERTDVLKIKFEALTTLIKTMLDVTKCIVQLKELSSSSQYITQYRMKKLTAAAHTPAAVYLTIRSVVACASQIMDLIGVGHEYVASTTEDWDLSSLVHYVSNIHNHLQEQLALCYHHIEEYQTLVRLFEMVHVDNMKILEALIYAKEDQLPLVDGSTKKQVNIDVLKRKNVLLLISDLDFPQNELAILKQRFQESRQQGTRTESQYEVVWLPVVDRLILRNDEKKQKRFNALQETMPWYSVYDPLLLHPAVINYIKVEWQFNKQPLLVVLDVQGRVVNKNAFRLMWIWGSLAFPFTSTKEKALWKQETAWTMKLLAESIDQRVRVWIADGKYICLYGGEDREWNRNFTEAAKNVAKLANISLELLYVGKGNPREKDSHIWFFWARLKSMWYSKMQHTYGKSLENDPIMKEIMTMLSFDGSDQGWAVVGQGSDMAKAKADTILKSLIQFQQWKKRAQEIGFVPALNEDLRGLHTPHHCIRLILPSTTGRIPEEVVCFECGRTMESFVMYRCCTD